MDRREDLEAGGRIGRSEGSDLPATPDTTNTTSTNLVSEVDSNSPILPHQQEQRESSRNTSYASIPLPSDDNNNNTGINSNSNPSSAPPRSYPKWIRPLITALSATIRFLDGPPHRIKTYINPFFPRFQSAPSRIMHKYLPKSNHRRALQFAFWAVWLTIFIVITHWSRFRTSVGGVHANPDGGGVRQLTCTSAMWWRNNDCGINGQDCQPFKTTTAMPFRCPSGCLSSGQLLNPRQVGNQSVIYQPLVVGGPGPDVRPGEKAYDAAYRADSFICPAAVHAGVISNSFGGCGLLLQTGSMPNGKGLFGSRRNGVSSTSFDADFPSTYAFIRPPDGTKIEGCLDLRWHLLPISSVFTFLQALLSTNAAVFFGTIFTAIFWHVGLISDPPPPQINRNDQFEVVSLVVGRFLPAAFIAYILYLHVIGPTLATNISPQFWSPKAPFKLSNTIAFERAVLVLLGWWFAALNNVTFAKIIPLARLTPHDLATQPGAKTALGIIITVLICIAIGQIYFFRREGRLLKYLGLYLSFGLGLLILTFSLGDMAVRIHHYILALLLLPGTKLGSRLSMLYQGILMGLFVNGAARWGFASLLETRGVLLGDAVYGSGKIPMMMSPIGGNVIWEQDPEGVWRGNWEEGEELFGSDEVGVVVIGDGDGEGKEGTWQNVTIRWRWPTDEENRLYDSKTGLPILGAREWDGISVLVNDVERFRGLIPEYQSSPSTTTTSAPSQTGTSSSPPTPTTTINDNSNNNSTLVGSFTWSRRQIGDGDGGDKVWEKLYIRMAFTTTRNSRGVGDFTRAGLVGWGWPEKKEGEVGGWVPPADGRT